jgi:hypothetical protein
VKGATVTPITRTPYEPPTGDEPLDDIERAFVRAMISALLAEIREEEAAAAQSQTPVATQLRADHAEKRRPEADLPSSLRENGATGPVLPRRTTSTNRRAG